MWNPSSQKLLNIEEDEAGRLARFRERFGRGWDAESTAAQEEVRYNRDVEVWSDADCVTRLAMAKRLPIGHHPTSLYWI